MYILCSRQWQLDIIHTQYTVYFAKLSSNTQHCKWLWPWYSADLFDLVITFHISAQGLLVISATAFLTLQPNTAPQVCNSTWHCSGSQLASSANLLHLQCNSSTPGCTTDFYLQCLNYGTSIHIKGNQDSLVTIVTRLQGGQSRVQIQNIQNSSGPNQSIQSLPEFFYQAVMQLRCGADCSPSSGVEAEHEWNCTYASPVCLPAVVREEFICVYFGLIYVHI